MASWGRVVAGVVIGVAGTIYATNEDVRKNLPRAARDLPDNIRRRYQQVSMRRSLIQVTLGGALVVGVGVLLGHA